MKSITDILSALRSSFQGWVAAQGSHRHLFIGATWALGLKIVGAGLNFGLQVLLARLMGVEEYGLFAYATSWLVVLSIPAQLGLKDLLTRYIPQYRVTGRPERLRGLLVFAAKSTLVASLCVALLFSLGLLLRPSFLSDQQISVLWLMLCVLPFFSLNSIRESCLLAFGKVASALAPESILRPILLATLSVFLYLSAGKLPAYQAWLLNIMAFVAAFVAGAVFLKKYLPQEIRFVEPDNAAREWLAVSMPMLLMMVLNVLLDQSGVLFLGAWRSASDVGVYAVCTRIVLLINLTLISVNAVLGPAISNLYHGGRLGELQGTLRTASRGIFFITLGWALFMLLFGRYVLAAFGPEFSRGYGVLGILMAGQIINASCGSVGLLLKVTGHQVAALGILAVAVIVHVGASIWLIPPYGVVGAAVASCLSLVTWNAAMLVYSCRYLRLNPSIVG